MKAATNLLDFGFIAVTDTQERGMWNFVSITLSYGLFNNSVSSSGYIASTGNEWWNGKDVAGSGRGPYRETMAEFAWRDWMKPQKSSSRIVTVPTENGTGNFRIKFRSYIALAIFLVISSREGPLAYL
jgi:hypothetical protein